MTRFFDDLVSRFSVRDDESSRCFVTLGVLSIPDGVTSESKSLFEMAPEVGTG